MYQRWVFAAIALAIPFVAYLLYRRLARRKGPEPWPTMILWLTGVVLAAEALLLFAVREEFTRGGGYEPPPRDQPAIYDREPPKP